jgi:hypothetical protein
MKRNDDVFFFTLVDFLLQVFFFGLLLYVVSKVAVNSEVKRVEEAKEKIQKVEKWTGFSSITELTDYLSNLAPPDDFRGWADFMSKHTDVKAVEGAVVYVEEKGGLEDIKDKVKKFEEAFGLPPCFVELADGRKNPKSVATLLVEDAKISLVQTTREFDDLLSKNGIRFEVGQGLSLQEFSKTFTRFKQAGRSCNVHVVINLRTDLNRPYFAALSGFAALRVLR